MTRKASLPIHIDDLVRRYVDGESVKALAESLGISRGPVQAWLTEAGVATRNRSDAMYQRMANTSPEGRAALASAAHDAVRGVKRTAASLETLARSRELKGFNKRSPGELKLAEMLRAQGLDVVHEKAVGKYNVDLAAGSVGVEILGGSWHRTKPHGERLRYLLDCGWDVIYIWVDPIYHPLGPGAAEYVISHFKFRERYPAGTRCYRVIRGTGQFLAGGSADGDDIPDVLPHHDRPDVAPTEVPFGFCHCGCGRETAPFLTSNATKGVRKGDPHRYISGHNRSRNPR